MNRLLIASLTALAAAPAAAQTVEIAGQNTIVDQLTPPGGRCVPVYFNTVAYGPGDVRSEGTTNLGPIGETATHCVTSLPPTDIVDGRFTITFRAGDTITGTFDGRVDATATPGTFAATKALTITGGTGRFAGASGTIDQAGQLVIAAGLGTYTGTLTGAITTTATTESGNFATAQGDGSAALGNYASAYGGLSIAAAERATAVGSQAEASGIAAVALGDQTLASGLRSSALGAQAQATGVAASALGHNSVASALAATAVGVSARATQAGATALGRLAAAEGAGATALGAQASASGANALAAGSGAQASGEGSVALGDQVRASALRATALGTLAQATGTAGTALGHNTQANALAATAVGVSAQANQVGATAIGRLANAAFAGSTALGTGATTIRANEVALGGAGSSVRVGDIAASTAAQTGAIGVATVDASGTLGRDTSLFTNVAALQAGAAALQSSLSGLGGQVTTLFDLRELDRRDFKKGIAAAVAMGSAPFPSAAGRTSYVLNGAVFRGEPAVGGSLMHRFDSDAPVALSVGFSFAGKKNNAFRAGVAGEF